MKTTFVAAAVAALALAACTRIPSDGIATREIFARYEVVVSGGVAEARASFTVGEYSNTYLELVRGDSVSCNGVPLRRDGSIIGEVHYSATLPSQPDGYSFQLRRVGESIYTSVGGTSGLAITSPAEGARVSISQPLQLRWTPGAGGARGVEVELDGVCTSRVSFTTNDQGRDAISPDQLVLRGASSCPARLTLRRSVERVLAGPFAGGLATSGEESSVAITLVP